jgi:hypothetical protein
MDDRAGRAAVRALDVANIDLMGTAAHLRVLEVNYGITLAATAWVAIATVLQRGIDRGVESDPVLILD